ncbi:hypothetical protein OPW33_00280 [Vibrio europaeus]|uniref:hypothetical protein n=1 Tax=Vibrio europaeus TaxID=300876 RepID=UPI002341B07C|nr:hypothetical protein [Vibrio europaeus]MDC5837761.1 hypothetical protein [Vibrio europaeus]
MSEAALEQEFDLDGLDFSPELIADLEAIEPTPQPEAEQEEEAKQDYSGAKGEMTAEWMIEMIEAGFKSFINEDYALPDKKKAVIVNNFTPVLNKYDGGIVGLLGDYKEEGQALFAVAILGFSMWMSVKEMKRKPVASEGGEDGKK